MMEWTNSLVNIDIQTIRHLRKELQRNYDGLNKSSKKGAGF